jgi:hypothetical protein
MIEMPRRKQEVQPVTVADSDPWQSFLEAMHLVGGIAVEENLTEAKETKPKVQGEMKIFAERLIYALCPPEKGYAPIIVKTVKSIYNVLEGRKDFGEWFTQVRQALSLKSYQLAQIIYQCLEGLRSREARELREQWFNFLQAELRGYGVI